MIAVADANHCDRHGLRARPCGGEVRPSCLMLLPVIRNPQRLLPTTITHHATHTHMAEHHSHARRAEAPARACSRRSLAPHHVPLLTAHRDNTTTPLHASSIKHTNHKSVWYERCGCDAACCYLEAEKEKAPGIVCCVSCLSTRGAQVVGRSCLHGGGSRAATPHG